jgi:basic membrane protein A
MRPVLSAAFVAAPLFTLAAPTLADPALVYSTGGKFDASFNQAAFDGAERWAAETGGAYAEFEPQAVGQMAQALRRFASRGNDPVVAIGFLQAGALSEVAPEFPDTRFAIIDAVVEAPNVQSVVFKEQEGAYVIGVLAAMASETETVGMVGGMDIPLIRRFGCGFAQGAKAADPQTEVLINFAGDTPAAFADPARGAELARSQIDRGADVILQAAGGTGIGVLQAAADAGVLGIGTDSNQNGLHPGHVLTSLRKRVDVAVVEAFTDWAPGVRVLGLAESGMDWVIDDNNRALISEEMEANARFAAAGIAAGDIVVHDSSVDGPCPAL